MIETSFSILINLQVIKEILRITGNQFIDDYYTSQNTLPQNLKNLLLRTLSSFFISKNDGKMPTLEVKRRLAAAIVDTYPSLYTDATALVGQNARNGYLSNAFKYQIKRVKLNAPPTNQAEIEEEENIDLEQNVEEVADPDTDTEEDYEEALHLLQNVSDPNSDIIEQALVDTFDIRRKSMLKGESLYIFEMFFTYPYYIEYDFGLLLEKCGVDDANRFIARKEVLCAGINTIFSSNFLQKKNFVNELNHETQPYAKIIALLYNSTKQGMKAKLSSLVKSIHENQSVADTYRLSSDTQHPFIIERESDPREYMISVDHRVIPLSTGDTLDNAIEFIYKIFQLWHLEYPVELQKFFVFYDAITFKINKKAKKTGKVMDLIGQLSTFMEEGNSDNEYDNSSNN